MLLKFTAVPLKVCGMNIAAISLDLQPNACILPIYSGSAYPLNVLIAISLAHYGRC